MLEVIGVVFSCFVDGIEGLLRDERGNILVALFRGGRHIGLLWLRGRHVWGLWDASGVLMVKEASREVVEAFGRRRRRRRRKWRASVVGLQRRSRVSRDHAIRVGVHRVGFHPQRHQLSCSAQCPSLALGDLLNIMYDSFTRHTFRTLAVSSWRRFAFA